MTLIRIIFSRFHNLIPAFLEISNVFISATDVDAADDASSSDSDTSDPTVV
jgi:hypothetical protein